ncbi:MAG: hypothetical protein Ct9H300mP18_08230 [Candidatus Neomarinimicrobiota bacterium]|nr:MAG: hypothetical protein Ct9H300mP18_08230 [Candidatus Neomarinimicrobiota bacterium]
MMGRRLQNELWWTCNDYKGCKRRGIDDYPDFKLKITVMMSGLIGN